jgi:hypothetical protein
VFSGAAQTAANRLTALNKEIMAIVGREIEPYSDT